MANLNKVMLIGNLTQDVELKYTPRGLAVTELRMAINRRVKGDNEEWKDETTYVDVTVWGRQAEVAKEYLAKGRSVFIEGRLQLDTWDDKQTGQKRSKLRVVSENMQMLGARGESGGGGSGGKDSSSASEDYDQRPARAQSSPGGGGGGARPKPRPAPEPVADDDDDIPF